MVSLVRTNTNGGWLTISKDETFTAPFDTTTDLAVSADCWKSMSLNFGIEGLVGDKSTLGFWDTLFKVLGMSTANYSQTGGQTERVNRVIDDTRRSV
ncbi:Pol protein [Phytophthora palmivora]|uniref:Pol protein n=1 Tax=Phytophthora palmivora TaxID=4796 RepID=A0A2P4XUY9_9STRA|nr:Pol protein [Phytophthora palmivora]